MTLSGNTMRVGRNDGGGGVLSPDYGIIIENSKGCIIRNNTMMDGARKQLVVAQDNTDCLIDDNLGSLADANWQSGSKLLN